eukprot:gene3942-7152_t
MSSKEKKKKTSKTHVEEKTNQTKIIKLIKVPIINKSKESVPFAPKRKFESDPIIIEEPEDDIGKYFYPIFKSFCIQNDKNEFDFDNSLSSIERYRLHSLSEDFNLHHYVHGTNQNKFFTIHKRNQPRDDQFQYLSYIGLIGPNVDYSANLNRNLVPNHYVQQRMKRDGIHHHITLMLKNDIQKAFKKLPDIKEYSKFIDEKKWKNGEHDKLECLMNVISNCVTDDWFDQNKVNSKRIDCGLGYYSNEKDETYFKVIKWPSADKFRNSLGLDMQWFHISVGYLHQDVYGVEKSEKTLINKSPLSYNLTLSSDFEDLLDYLDIPSKFIQIFEKHNWNIENIKHITLSDLKELESIL